MLFKAENDRYTISAEEGTRCVRVDDRKNPHSYMAYHLCADATDKDVFRKALELCDRLGVVLPALEAVKS